MPNVAVPNKTQAYYRFVGKLEDAVEREHTGNCDANYCDIDAALRNGFPVVAANLLESATECPATERALQRLRVLYPRIAGTHTYDGAEWPEWEKFFHANSVECHKCGSFIFTDEWKQERCGNCLAELKQEQEEEE